MKIALFCPNLIGDTVMATPAMRSIRAGFPDAIIRAVAKPFVAPTLDGLTLCDDIILFDAKSNLTERQTPHVLQELKGWGPDLAVLFPNSFRSAIMAWRSGAKKRLGYARGGRGILLTDRITPPNRVGQSYTPMPIVDYYMGLARSLGCPDLGRNLEQVTLPADDLAADQALKSLGVSHANPLVVFNTGGAFGPAKNWPVSSFALLAQKLLNAIPKAAIVVVCGPAEAENARKITELVADPRVVSLADKEKSIGLTKAVIKRSQLVVTTDSGPRHFATAFGIPTVSLFGPTHIAWTRTFHPNGIHLQKQVDCGPCQKGVCPETHHKCMTELTPNDVLNASLELLGWERLLPSPHVRAWSVGKLTIERNLS